MWKVRDERAEPDDGRPGGGGWTWVLGTLSWDRSDLRMSDVVWAI